MARFTSIWCMSPSTEILTIGAFGFVHAATQCYWYFGEGKTDRILSSVDTQGHFTAWEDKVIKSALHGMEFVKNALTPLHLFFYLLMFHALMFEKSPARMVPWLMLGALKDVALGALLTLTEAFLCYVVNLPRACAEVTVFLIVELAVQLYLWGSALLLYQELANREITAEGDAYWASAASAAMAQPSASATPSEWEAAPAGQRTTPKRRLDESLASLPDRPLESACSGPEPVQETRPTKKRAVHGEAGRSPKPRVNKAVQANTLSRRWLLANANAQAATKMKESTSPRTRRSAGRVPADGSSPNMAQSRSQYAHRDVSPRAAAAWAEDAEDASPS